MRVMNTMGTPSEDRARGTASAEEIARFTALAEDWWDEEGPFRPLHRLNPVRIAYIRDRATEHFRIAPGSERPLDGLTAIDIGCGGGLVSEPLARLGARVTAIDASQESVRIAQLHAERQHLDVEYRAGVPEDLAAEGRQFDLVVAMEVVEHVADLDAFLGSCARLVKPGGALAMATLNRTVKSMLFAKVGAEYVLRWLPIGTHNWRKFIGPAELAAGLRRHGVEMLDAKGMTYAPVSGTWRLSYDLDVNYIAFASRR